MVTSTTSNVIYLGNAADIDTLEGNFLAEGASALLGNYNNLSIITVTEVDQNDDRTIHDDDNGNTSNDRLTYNTGSGPQTVGIDSTVRYSIKVTKGDGTTFTANFNVVQTRSGDIFLYDLGQALDNITIQSIEITGVVNANFNGYLVGSSIIGSRIVCFVEGTLIQTPHGAVPVEDLRISSEVLTRDGGVDQITGIAEINLATPGKNSPIAISAGALGYGQPFLDLRISPQHRVMIDSPIAERMFGQAEMLVPATQLVGWPGISQSLSALPVRYIHFRFDQHRIVIANGAYVESFYEGQEAQEAPMASSLLTGNDMAPALPFLKGRQLNKLLQRHAKNNKPLVANPLPAIKDLCRINSL